MSETSGTASADEEAGEWETLSDRGDVFVTPVDRTIFDRTVNSPVDPTEHDDPPDAIADRDSVRLWGVEPGTRNEQTFEKLDRGDLVLFYVDGRYVGVGTVGTTFPDPDGWVAETFWEGSEMRHVYTVESFEAIDVPRPALNGIFGYQPEYDPGGLTRVAPDRVDARLSAIRLAVERYTARSS